MRNAVGSYILFVIVIFFVVLFSGYICISINKAKAFNTKNEIVKAVERYAPNIDPGSFVLKDNEFTKEIQRIMKEAGYRNDGKCEDDKNVQGYTKDGYSCSNSKCAFCIKTTDVKASGSKLNGSYYKITTFYHLDLPIISSVFNLKTTGETKVIYFKSKEI